MVKVGSWLYSFDPVKVFRVQLLLFCHSCDHRATKVLAENVLHLEHTSGFGADFSDELCVISGLNGSCCCLAHIKRKDFPDFGGPK